MIWLFRNGRRRHKYDVFVGRVMEPLVECKGRMANPGEVAREMVEEAQADRECCWVLHLNTAGRIVAKELVSMGTVDYTTVHPREVFRKAILNGSHSIIVVHNHPSGKVDPSDCDFEICRQLVEAGKVVGIEVTDFVIVEVTGGWWSWVESCKEG